MNEWIIQSRSHTCQVCERHFEHKEHYHTLLQTTKHELVRLDICKSCWEAKKAKGEAEPKGYISQWTGIYHAPTHVATVEPIQKENAESLLRKLIEADDPKYGPACYILAVMLERKRLLKIKEQFKRDGTRVFVYEHPKSGDVFTITDPNLQLNQLMDVQKDVGDLLANGFMPAQPSPAASQPSEPSAAEPTDTQEAVSVPEPAPEVTETSTQPQSEAPSEVSSSSEAQMPQTDPTPGS